MQRMLLANAEGVSCADCEALQHPAVIASDWIGFICLFGSASVLVIKLMSFKGPDQDDGAPHPAAGACTCGAHPRAHARVGLRLLHIHVYRRMPLSPCSQPASGS